MFNSFESTIIVMGAIMVGIFFYCYKTSLSYEKFKKDGVRTEAKILSMEKIGASGTGNTKMKMKLQFESEQGPVTVTTKEYISPQNLIKIMRNNTILIYYMPKDPKQVFLVPFEME
ncbi:DUF3592 domain-containing protein [Cronobacter sakazakii]|uniref:DUF3592 domain-containing protein n=1 Tax=Cronobacter sakazakii TaxID=28141 RepID=UPI00084E17E3|nr:DUF3592 domain-containing protein [Cronobacter sakazakii]EJG0604924.1 DUF3592 domain-containing protein [Cronobacter sakazakii]EJG0609225.1 DUF3592 domain-containing protein [Cronobacter sakazakii]EJG0613390.1 DUF3592 domain-containing protein [Cronobacter sakazakii]EJG0757740.1 DUF3592 domain-containing protein [Cronobacter sakazakii]EJK9928678.1 DUF3592 domain-containing protein [Cronobacter sakazakii]